VVTGGSVAAIVNGRAVPISLYRSLLTLAERQSAGQPGVTVQSLAQQTMNEVIADALIEQYAVAHHITLSDSELNAQIQRDEAQTHGQKALQQALTRVGITFSTYKTLLRMNLLGQKVEKQVAPLNSKPELVAHVRHILIMLHPQGKPALTDAQAHAKAERILNQVQHGGNFAALARANSDDTGSAAQGGDLGNVYPGQTVPQFNQAAFALPLNHPALIHTVYGYHIVEVLSRRTQTPPLQSQQQAQQQAFSSWIDRQMKDASIKRLARVKA
jgi:parvulin-like peptidyl-prolyl isomerase